MVVMEIHYDRCGNGSSGGHDPDASGCKPRQPNSISIGGGKFLLIASFTLVHIAIQTHISRSERDVLSICYTKVRTGYKLRGW
jgi:hypothetical protein